MKRLWPLLFVIVLAPLAIFALRAVRQEQAAGAPSGERLFANHCAACHQPSGSGIAGIYPPLDGHVPIFLEVDGGREQLIQTILHGIRGPITALGNRYEGIKPPWRDRLNDAEIASILNYTLTAWGNAALLPEGFTPIAPEEVAALREPVLSQDEVHAQRLALLGE